MTEQDYILVGDLKTIRHAHTVLENVCPANNPHVTIKELRQAFRLLEKWDEAITADVQGRVEEGE